MFQNIKKILKTFSFIQYFNAPHKKFFWGALAFLIGIYSASFGNNPFLSFLFLAFFILFFLLAFIVPRRGFGFLSFFFVCVLFGNFYFVFYEIRTGHVSIPFGNHVVVYGIVCDDPMIQGAFQKMSICLSDGFSGVILVKSSRRDFIRYGDEVLLSGNIETIPEDNYGAYLRKEGINGLMNYPEVQKISAGNGSWLKSILFSIKRAMFAQIEKGLPFERAAFLKGILFGDTGEFSSQLRDAMRKSGTTHLVALSGYNITIITSAIFYLLASFFAPQFSMIVAGISIFFFVLMTGAMPSVVRAGILGVLVLFGARFGKRFEVRNILLFSAVVMVMMRPRILVFDVGFQLSFLAFIGIVYVQPLLRRYFGIQNEGIFSWKESFISTLAAQLMVIPILLSQFGIISILSVPANIVILGCMPLTMALGFITLALSFISPFFFIFPGGVLDLLLHTELNIIQFFGTLSGTLSFSPGTMFFFVYYGILFGLLYVVSRTNTRHSREDEV